MQIMRHRPRSLMFAVQVCGFVMPGERPHDADLAVVMRGLPVSAAGALTRLRDALATHMTDAGVRLNSRAWIVTAHRR